MSKVKTKNSESNNREETSYIQGNPHRLLVGFSTEIFSDQEKMGWYIQNIERKNCQPIILYPAQLSFRNEVEIKTLPNKQKFV